MKVFVTGGAGFIGRHLTRSLLEKKYQVTIFDNFSNSSEETVSDLLEEGADCIKGDITKQNQISKAIQNHDVIVHLAAKINVQESFVNPTHFKNVNVNGTKNLLNACKENNIKNIIAASSAAVYGDCKDPRYHLSENSKTSPMSPYGESKLEMEKIIKTNSDKRGINAIILRFFNIYGIGQPPEYAGVITKFLQKINQSKPLEIYGDGNQTRDFVSINDAVDSINDAITKIQNKQSDVYNIASGKSISINDLAKLTVSISGKNLDIIHSQAKKGDIMFSQADISLAKNELGFFPTTTLKQGIKNLINRN